MQLIKLLIMSIAKNLQDTINSLPDHVQLVVVSKTRTHGEIMEAYQAGQRHFGESKAQELTPKAEELPEDIQWHMVGHLQSNKVKYIVPFVALIHSVDKLKLLKVIDKEGKKNNRVIPVLLQLHIAEESTKFGMDYDECCELLESDAYAGMEFVSVRGMMGMATFTDDKEQVRREFRQLKKHFDSIRDKYFPSDDAFSILSMGMSDDYPEGIEEGSNMVRIGTAIFGPRK